MRIARTLADLAAYQDETVARARFHRAPIGLDEQNDWSIEAGVLSHRSGGFFHVAGYLDRAGGEHLLLYQPQNALNGLAVHRADGQVFLLLQARVEPGNSHVLNYGPTVQSTAANYMRMHGGKKTTNLELFLSFHPQAQPVLNSTQFDIGAYYLHKTKTICVVETDDWLPTEDNMIWVELTLLLQALRQSHIVNTDLRSLLTVVDWSSLLTDAETPPPCAEAADLMRLSSPRAYGLGLGRMIPLAQLKDWRVSRFGVEDVADRGRSVAMCRTKATNREVASWSQPLLQTRWRSCAALYVRNWSRAPEILITFGDELGVSGGAALLPSYLRYGDENPSADADALQAGRAIIDCTQSEEGGRFDGIETRYLIIETPSDHPVAKNQRWVSPTALGSLLRMSNRSSMLLRCVSSLILPRMHPGVLPDLDPAPRDERASARRTLD